jgi:hypothetical protein
MSLTHVTATRREFKKNGYISDGLEDILDELEVLRNAIVGFEGLLSAYRQVRHPGEKYLDLVEEYHAWLEKQQ